MSETVFESVSPVEYLKMLAVARIFLDNITNIQVSWLTQGLDIAQVALYCGANDIGSIMIEENVISTAGAHHTAGSDRLVQTIRRAGFTPVQRDTLYTEFHSVA